MSIHIGVPPEFNGFGNANRTHHVVPSALGSEYDAIMRFLWQGTQLLEEQAAYKVPGRSSVNEWSRLLDLVQFTKDENGDTPMHVATVVCMRAIHPHLVNDSKTISKFNNYKLKALFFSAMALMSKTVSEGVRHVKRRVMGNATERLTEKEYQSIFQLTETFTQYARDNDPRLAPIPPESIVPIRNFCYLYRIHPFGLTVANKKGVTPFMIMACAPDVLYFNQAVQTQQFVMSPMLNIFAKIIVTHAQAENYEHVVTLLDSFCGARNDDGLSAIKLALETMERDRRNSSFASDFDKRAMATVLSKYEAYGPDQSKLDVINDVVALYRNAPKWGTVSASMDTSTHPLVDWHTRQAPRLNDREMLLVQAASRVPEEGEVPSDMQLAPPVVERAKRPKGKKKVAKTLESPNV